MNKYFTGLAVVGLVAILAIVGQVANMPGPRPPTVHTAIVTPRQIDYQRAEETAAQVLVANGCSDEFASPIGRAAVDHGLQPQIMAGLVFVESSCRADAISSRGSVGLAQINTRVWHVSRNQALDPAFNLDKGSEILAGYVQAHGLRNGLRHYNGMGYTLDDYPARVLYAANRR